MSSTIVKSEIEQFQKDSAHWWDENGPFKPLHRMNPARLSFIKQEICTHFKRDYNSLDALKNLDIIDVGCGGGLICEPLSRMGGNVSGLDADEQAIDVAAAHALQSGLQINYSAGELSNEERQYDVVLALEILEHVSDVSLFISQLEKILKPDGLLILSTLNRTVKSYALGVIAAEYILRWVPRGTHSWNKFIRPSELSRYLRHFGMAPKNTSGIIFNPANNSFSLSPDDLDINYCLSAVKR